MFISLKPLNERKISVDQIIARLRPKLAQSARRDAVPAGLAGPARRRTQSNAQYQFTMRGDNLDDLIELRAQDAGRVAAHSHHHRRQQRPAESRPASHGSVRPHHRARFGISPQLIDNTLYDAFGQRQVSTMYER